MTRLNQIIAVETGVKADTQRELTDVYHALQKPALFTGIGRTYTPKDDGGDKLPSESTRVQMTAAEMLRTAAEGLTHLLNVTATKDWANCAASADVCVGTQVLFERVPVTYLLFLEKWLADFETTVKKMPTLDPSETWHYDALNACYATEAVDTVKTKKVPRNHVKAEATKEHPAQVEVYYEDVVVGSWRTVKYSGALPQHLVRQVLEQVRRLREAVKFAREAANGLEVREQSVGDVLFDYVLAPLKGVL